MEDLFFSCESAYEGCMSHTNTILEYAIFEYTEELLTNHYVTESTRESLWLRLKKFFTKIILAIKDFTKELQSKMQHVINEKQIRHKLDDMRKTLKEKKSVGVKTMTMTDYKSMQRVFDKHYDTLIGFAKKFAKVKYTKTWQIEDDLNEFEKILKTCNDELEDASKKTITITIDKALDFVEDEIRGKSEVFKNLINSIDEFEEIRQLAENLKIRMDILGADVIPKHVGFIQRMVNSIANFVRKWTIKIMMGVIFIFPF